MKAEEDTSKEKREQEKMQKEREAAKLKRIWSREDALKGLKKVFLVSLEGTIQKSVDKKSGEAEVKFNASAASAATKAIEAANKMLGYQEPSEGEAEDMNIEVEFYIDNTELCE